MSSLSNPHSPSPEQTLNQASRVTTPLSKKTRKQVSFQRQITSTQLSYLSSNDPHAPGQEKEAKVKASFYWS